MKNPVFIVCLRQPGSKEDPRSDPYWETGSFGCTGCHEKNLLHPRKAHIPVGARLAFAQGGPKGVRLVMLTPPITLHKNSEHLEILWKPGLMPFRYEDAPLLVDRAGKSDFPKLKFFIKDADRSAWMQKFASCFRSRVLPLSVDLAAEITQKFDNSYSKVSGRRKAVIYLDALPSTASHKKYMLANSPYTRNERIRDYRRRYGAHRGVCRNKKTKCHRG